MSLLDRARRDNRRITTNDGPNGFAVIATFIHPTGDPVVEVKCLHTVHHNAVDTDGVQVDAKIASVAVHELELIDLEYPTRNAQGVVSFEGHRISAPDSTGTVRTYICREKFADENLGLIVILLTDYTE